MSSQALIDTFWCDIDIIDQIIEEKADPTVDSEHRYDNVKSESVRDVYKRIKRDNGQELDLNIMQDTIIDDQIIIVLKQRKDPVKFPAKISGKNEELLTYKTLGDGACGDHALVGEVKNGYYRAANPLETRKKLCEHLQKCFDENNVPLGIQLLLEDSFRKPDMMGAQFREALKITENGKEIDLLDKFKKANKTAEDFASDKQVFKAYLASLSNPNTYLAIEELGILATCLNKSLRLFKQSDTDPKEVTELEDGPVFSRTPGEEVVVYFNAKGQHFERAVIRAKNS
ncbi:MAG: hypothetical protein HWD61_12955 [Parachlamydiaceae bacterium]|nr:MAG: hypothetical protein HWD61_12955 [Parachlamydiaceae bacterium]